MWSWVGPTNAPPASITPPLRSVVVEHPPADPIAGLDHEHRPAGALDLPGRDQSGDAGADHDHVDLRGQRALEAARAVAGSVGGELGEGGDPEGGAERGAGERGAAEDAAAGERRDRS